MIAKGTSHPLITYNWEDVQLGEQESNSCVQAINLLIIEVHWTNCENMQYILLLWQIYVHVER